MAFWMAAQRAVRMNETSFRDKYERYTRHDSGNPDVRRKALTAVAAKMARVAYAVVKHDPPYHGYHEHARRFFATTNCIENLIGTVRHVTRNIKRCRDGDMRRRWIGLGLLRAAERFRRIKRHGELDVLVTALGAANLAERAA